MGKVMEHIEITNLADFENARSGLIEKDRVRKIEIQALVDTGATSLAIPLEVQELLGLRSHDTTKVRFANGKVEEVPWVSVRLEILGRAMTCDALVMPRGTTALIGQIPLERLDLLVDPKTRALRVNPASPDVPLLDLLAVA